MAYDLSKAQLRFTKEQFKATNPTPAADVLCVETDSNVYTTGDGSSAYLSIRGNTTLSGDQRTHADTAYATMGLSDSRDEVGEPGEPGEPGGANGEIQFNNAGAFDGKNANELSDYLDTATDPFVRTSDLPAAADPDGSFGFEMLFDTGTAGDPGAQSFNFNHATPGSITLARITVIDVDGEDNSAALSLINPRRGDIQVTHEDGTALFTINGTGALNGTFYEAPVDYVSGPLPANNAPCRVVYLPGERTGVLEYVAIMTQADTDAPTVTVLQNDLSGPIVWTRNVAGRYDGTLVGAFTANKVARLFQNGYDNESACFYQVAHVSADLIQVISCDDTGVQADGLIQNATIRITVYP